MNKIFSTLLIIFILTGCATAQLAPTPAAPSATAHPTFVFPTPSPEPSPSAIPAKTVAELGITDADIIKAFSGATFKQETDGNYSVQATSYTENATNDGFVQNLEKYTIDKTTFSNNPDIKNAYAPATVSAVDNQGNKVILIWDGEHGSWRVPFPMVDNSDLSKVDQIPFVPEGDQKIAVESALLYLKDHPPFTDAAVQSYKKYGGNSLLFTYDKTQGKDVVLKAKGNDQNGLTQETATMKASPLWVYQIINGERQYESLFVNLDPSDPKNPKADEYKIIFGVGGSGYDLTKLNDQTRQYTIDSFYMKGNHFVLPIFVVYGDENYLKNNPLLASLLALPGNDPGKLKFFIPALGYVDQLGPKNTLLETQPYAEPLPPEIQTMRLFFQLGSH